MSDIQKIANKISIAVGNITVPACRDHDDVPIAVFHCCRGLALSLASIVANTAGVEQTETLVAELCKIIEGEAVDALKLEDGKTVQVHRDLLNEDRKGGLN